MSLEAFVRESNKIEGIMRDPTPQEIEAHMALIKIRSGVTVDDIARFVGVIAPKHVLRNKIGLDVRVGGHIAPPGGDNIKYALIDILAGTRNVNPYQTHLAYERLHPFTDGNGRSGRVLWLWHMFERGQGEISLRRGFLHSFYYQTLDAND